MIQAEEYIKIIAAIKIGTIKLTDLSQEKQIEIRSHIKKNKEARD